MLSEQPAQERRAACNAVSSREAPNRADIK
jgi:hypothetical protein